jgi:hypothetical protein
VDAGTSLGDAGAAGGSAAQDAGDADVASAQAGASAEGGARDTCSGRLLECYQSCVDPKFDPQNCGACGTVCDAGELCSAGQCATTCLGGSTLCGARCVDLDRDPAHCGSCDAACSSDQVCTNGVCGLVCSGGTTRCGSSCVDLRYDPAHCGSCDMACAAGAVCTSGTCGVTCESGRKVCSGECTDLTLDPSNCGGCGHACAAGHLCSDGLCGTACNDSIRCDNACVDPLTDSANCGGCNRPCGPGETCANGSCGLHCDASSLTQCGTTCTDTKTDAHNCGSCYAACAANQTCSAGKCVCSGGKSQCQGECIDLTSNAANCGVCGVACGTNEVCTSNKCDCRAGTQRCGGSCIDTSVSAANCGACGSVCAAGKICTNGTCAAATSDWPTFQFGVTHGGENPDETGKPPLALSWQRKFGSAVHPAAAESGRVFITPRAYFSATSPLVALNLSDGSDLWSYNFGAVDSLGHPAVFAGSVYLANGKGITTPSQPFLWSIDAASGVPNWGAALTAQWEQYFAPIVVGSVAYTNAGTYGGLFGISTVDGAQEFFVSLDQTDQWSPGYFSGHIFTFINDSFRKHDPATGAVLGTLALNSTSFFGFGMNTAPVFDDARAYVIAPPNLLAIDPAQLKVVWTANGTYTGTPAVAGGLVYAISAGNLVVRNAVTGILAWTFVGDAQLSYPPVIANGYVYVASNSNIYAVEIATHSQAFTAAFGGWLSISSSRLLIAGQDGTLSAFLMSK